MPQALDVEKIVGALKEKRGASPVRELLKRRVRGIKILEGSTPDALLTGKLIVERINPSWLIPSKGIHKSQLRTSMKRAIDLCISLVMKNLCNALTSVTANALKLDSQGSVNFSQEELARTVNPECIAISVP